MFVELLQLLPCMVKGLSGFGAGLVAICCR